MRIALIIIYLSSFAWIFPIFRQYKSNLFYFFLFLGISDPLTILLFQIFRHPPGIISVIFAPILLLLFRFFFIMILFYTINIDRQKKFSINSIEIFVFLLTFILFFTVPNNDVIMLVIHTMILIRVLSKILIELHHKQIVNIFHIVLAFYMTTSVASLLVFLNGDYQAMVLFYINLAFQILIAIFFSLFSEDNPKLIYNVTPAIKD